ncbi:energy-coupling factor ABC transporter permease [Alteromonas sp. C1M14]|uniref:energy-coupling factor ABC transporter permease n=1 Tax=Alteromonas sp. C1M14 TaxID=2841567 RepID=UPI001C080063|nr:energy-coupling factor ABC transporter permease [Alteromonas sp. C1M14]
MTTLQLICLVIYGALLIYIGKQVSWSSLLANTRRQHIIFGFTALMFFLWIFRVGIFTGLDVHFLWLPALALTVGFRWAIIAASVALLGTTLVHQDGWAMFGVNGLLGLIVPIAVCYALFMLAFHKIPRNLFVYIFVCAFFPGALIIALKMTLLSGYFVLDGHYSWGIVRDNYLILIPLLLFPEGLLNGMTMTLLTIYKPEWIYTFHDKFYIDGK